MKVIVEINCDTIGELGSHLNELFKQVKKECKNRKLDPFNDEFPAEVKLEDDNCYGDHLMTIIPE